MSSGPSTSMKLLTLWSMKRKRGLAAKAAMFSRVPVEPLSMQSTWSPRWRKLSHRCEPMKPAPPVMRILAISPADGIIAEAELSQVVGVVDVPAVEDHGLFEQPPDGVEVGAAELVPLRDDDERVGALERVVVAPVVADAVAEDLFRLGHRLGVVRLDLRAG